MGDGALGLTMAKGFAAASEAAASVNQSNSAQNLAYTQSLTESTKARVYELAELYYGE